MLLQIKQILKKSPEILLISPGPCSPKEAGISLEAIGYFKDKLPILGICLGHQAIGEAFGGKIVKAKRPIHGHVHEVNHDEKGMFTVGGTVNVSYGIPLGKTLQLRIQPYAQYAYLVSKFTYNENKYFYNPSTFGVNTFFSFLWGN